MRRDPSLVFSPVTATTLPWSPAWSVAGVIAALEPMVGETRKERILSVLSHRLMSVTVLLDRPHDPHNGAAVMRSCEAFGVQSVHVIPSEEEFLASNVVAKGSERWLDVTSHATPALAVQALSGAGYELITTHPKGELEPEALAEIPRVALVLGNEHGGVSPVLEQSAGRSVRIPMLGFVESLNVSVSAAILVRAAARGRPGDLTVEQHDRLYARGLFHSLQRSPEILAALPPA